MLIRLCLTGIIQIDAISTIQAGRKIPHKKETRCEKVVWVFMFRDLLSAFSYIRNRELTLKSLIKSYLTKKVCAVYSFNDPLPLFGFFYYMLIKGILSLYFKMRRLTCVIWKWIIGFPN